MALITNFSIHFYVCTFVMKALWSLTIVILGCLGFEIVAYDILHNRQMQAPQNQTFEQIYFLGTAVIEFISVVMCLGLYYKQRKVNDVGNIMNLDNQSQCFLLFLRIIFPVAFSIIQLAGIDSIERPAHQRYNSDPRDNSMSQYNVVFTYTLVILCMEITQILWFTYAVMNQPTNTKREIEFDSILTDQNAIEKIQMIR